MPQDVTRAPWENRFFGVELEMLTRTRNGSYLDHGDLYHAVCDGVLGGVVSDREGYYHSDGDAWNVKTDSSCGWEITTPRMHLDESGDNAELKSVLGELNGLRPAVNRQCGLHVHVDCSGMHWSEIQRMVRLWVRYEPFFFEIMPQSRRSTTYSVPVSRKDWREQVQGFWRDLYPSLQSSSEANFRRAFCDRYLSINTSAWWRHARVEFRLHSATLDYRKIKHWMMLISAIVERAGSSMPEIDTIERDFVRNERRLSTTYICKQLGLVPSTMVENPHPLGMEVAGWFNQRRNRFSPQQVEQVEMLTINESLRYTEQCAVSTLNCPSPRAFGSILCQAHQERFRSQNPRTYQSDQ